MPIEPIPDLLAELRAGRYPHDFVEALIGDGFGADRRRYALARVLPENESARGRILTSLVLLGARQMLDQVIRDRDGRDRNNHEIAAGLERLRDATVKELDTWTADLDVVFRS